MAARSIAFAALLVLVAACSRSGQEPTPASGKAVPQEAQNSQQAPSAAGQGAPTAKEVAPDAGPPSNPVPTTGTAAPAQPPPPAAQPHAAEPRTVEPRFREVAIPAGTTLRVTLLNNLASN